MANPFSLPVCPIQQPGHWSCAHKSYTVPLPPLPPLGPTPPFCALTPLGGVS